MSKNTALRGHLSLALVICCSSCSSLLRGPFSADARPNGGYDGPGGADQLYFVVHNMDGYEGGLNALCLPGDWPERERRRDARGRLVLAEPVTPVWRTYADLDPRPRRLRTYEELPASSSTYFSPVPLVVGRAQELAPGARLTRFEREARTALEAGANTYLLRPLDGDAFAAYEILGAVGPPLEWVHLGEVRFEDRRSAWEKAAWNGVGRPLVVLENAAWIGGIFYLTYLGIEAL